MTKQKKLPGAKAKRDAETWLKKGFITVGFEKATLKSLGDGSKEATLRFAVVLDREVAARLPAPIGTAFEEIRRKDTGMGFVEIEAGRIESQNWEFYGWPEKGKPDFEADAVQPEKVELEKDADSGNVLLRFSIRVPLLRDSGMWILTNFGNELWMKYEQAQLTLTDEKAKAAGA